jgi:hypothetical protein
MTRADLHRLVDELPDKSVDAAVVLLTRAKDLVLAALQAAPLTTRPIPRWSVYAALLLQMLTKARERP